MSQELLLSTKVWQISMLILSLQWTDGLPLFFSVKTHRGQFHSESLASMFFLQFSHHLFALNRNYFNTELRPMTKAAGEGYGKHHVTTHS